MGWADGQDVGVGDPLGIVVKRCGFGSWGGVRRVAVVVCDMRDGDTKTLRRDTEGTGIWDGKARGIPRTLCDVCVFCGDGGFRSYFFGGELPAVAVGAGGAEEEFEEDGEEGGADVDGDVETVGAGGVGGEGLGALEAVEGELLGGGDGRLGGEEFGVEAEEEALFAGVEPEVVAGGAAVDLDGYFGMELGFGHGLFAEGAGEGGGGIGAGDGVGEVGERGKGEVGLSGGGFDAGAALEGAGADPGAAAGGAGVGDDLVFFDLDEGFVAEGAEGHGHSFSA